MFTFVTQYTTWSIQGEKRTNLIKNQDGQAGSAVHWEHRSLLFDKILKTCGNVVFTQDIRRCPVRGETLGAGETS